MKETEITREDVPPFVDFLLPSASSHVDRLQLHGKGNYLHMEVLFGLMRSIDLSSNKLTGQIPKEISKLIGLISLDLSRNSLIGSIPSKIGKLKLLDSLDLSNNNLSGRIPSSLSQVDRLGLLDLSNNDLTGKIPTGTQLQNRDFSSYTGNPKLCGAPLPKKCPGDQDPTDYPKAEDQDHPTPHHQDEFITRGFFVSIGPGFVVGFWGFCGSLIFNESWRYGYFKQLKDAGHKIYVVAALHKEKLQRLIRG